MTQRLLSAGLVFAGMYAIVRGAPQAPSGFADVPRRHSRRRRQATGPLKPIWRFFGADEPNYAYMKDGKKLIADLGKLAPKRVYFRAHNLLDTGDGTPALKWGSTNAYTEDAKGNPIYDWTIVDRIFDTYLERGVKPYVQIGFMPKALSTKPEPYQHTWTPAAKYDEIYTGWAYPPKDYAKWGELVYQWAKHSVEKYGRAEVEQWYWETWNEANIGYWRGTPEEFRKLHDYAIDGVRRALPTARVGGPDTAGHGGQWMRDFLEHQLRGTNYATGKIGTPIDFVSFHAKGRPDLRRRPRAHGHRQSARDHRQGLPDHRVVSRAEVEADRHRRIRSGRLRGVPGTAAAVPQQDDVFELHGGELRAQARPRRTARRQPRRRADVGVRVRGQPYFAGFRALATNGIDLPVFNVFRMFSRMGRSASRRRATARSISTRW